MHMKLPVISQCIKKLGQNTRESSFAQTIMKTLSDREEKTNYISPNIFYLETCPNPGKLGDYMKEG